MSLWGDIKSVGSSALHDTEEAVTHPADTFDKAVSAVNSGASKLNDLVHDGGRAIEGVAQTGISGATDVVRHVAGNGAANAFHGAAEAVNDDVKQTVGFTYGVGEGAVGAVGGMVEGVGDLAKDGVKFATDGQYRGEVLHDAGQVASKFAHDPVGSVRALGSGVLNAGKDWLQGAGKAAQEGNLGEYLGRGLGNAAVQVGSFFVPGADAAEGANIAGHLGEAGEVLSDASKGADAVRGLDGANDAAHGLEGTSSGTVDRSLLKRPAEEAPEGEPAAKKPNTGEPDEGPAAAPKTVKSFDNLDEFNAAANKAEPNTVYKYGDYGWTTDGRGRTIEASGKVDVKSFGRNDPTLQTLIGKEGRDTDVGFHLIADSLNGPTNRLNVVAGNGKPIDDGLANLNQGAYKKFENQVRDLATRSDKPVEIRVRPEYDADNLTSRPDKFVAEFRAQGKPWTSQTFFNK